jgi:hypothetical protein
LGLSLIIHEKGKSLFQPALELLGKPRKIRGESLPALKALYSNNIVKKPLDLSLFSELAEPNGWILTDCWIPQYLKHVLNE